MRWFAALMVVLPLQMPPAWAQGDMRGHGGPVRSLAISATGELAISGSFDQSAIVWSLGQGRSLRILRVHDGSVNAVLALPNQYVTAGEDGRIAFWPLGEGNGPSSIVRAHEAPVAGLAVSRDGRWLASAGWDGKVRLQALAGDAAARVFEGHEGIVNAVAFLPDGRSLVSGGYDASVRIWRLEGAATQIIRMPAPVSALVVLPDGMIVAGRADGQVVLIAGDGAVVASIAATETPVTSLAASPDGRSIAAGSPRGAVAIIDTGARRVRFTLNGPGLPVWSLAYTPDGRQLLSGGADRIVRRWDAASGEHIGAISGAGADDELGAYAGMPGAEVFKACAVCHTLRPDGAGRAGPSLHGIFGRKAGTLPGYNYSEAFRKLDIVWNEETVSRLFEIGPQAYTPGTKMPEQTVGNARERRALIEFLGIATAPK